MPTTPSSRPVAPNAASNTVNKRGLVSATPTASSNVKISVMG